MSVGSTASNVSVTVDVKAGKPSSVPAAPAAGVVLNYLEFKAENLDQSNVKEARIKFKVSKADISSKNLNKATIALNRYASNAWSKLATTLAGEDSSSVFYEAVTPGFSVFAITGEEEEKKAAACGNSLCESSEGSANCCKDCGCPSGQSCISNSCIAAPTPPVTGPEGEEALKEKPVEEGGAGGTVMTLFGFAIVLALAYLAYNAYLKKKKPF